MSNPYLQKFLELRVGAENAHLYDPDNLPLDALRPVRELACGAAFFDALRAAVSAPGDFTIYGDYDADGVMATYILYTGLSRLCPGRVHHFINERTVDGYNITAESMEKCLAAAPDTRTVITCDNGINATEAIALAQSRGVTVLVTDHHVQTQLLPADTPALDEMSFDQIEADRAAGVKPERFCGAELARRVICALYADLGRTDADFLDGLYAYAAFATIADHVPMNPANHAVARRGLLQIRANEGFWGLLANECLGDRAGVVRDTTIGFSYAPMINASSRMTGSAETALRMLLSYHESADACRSAIGKLRTLNEARKERCANDDARAFSLIKANGCEKDPFILIADAALSEGVNGLTATHITERYRVPSAVLSPTAADPNVYKGSARSLEGFDLVAHLTSHGDLIRAGGHAMAAGLSVDADDLDEVRRLLCADAAGFTPPAPAAADFTLTPDALSWQAALDLQALYQACEPFGPEFQAPRISLRAKPLTLRGMGRGPAGPLHAKFALGRAGDGLFVDALWWRHFPEAKALLLRGIDLEFAGEITPHTFNGQRSIQLTARSVRPL